MITVLSGNHLSALIVLALIWLLLSISYMIASFTDIEKSFKEGIRLSLWIGFIILFFRTAWIWV